MVSSIPVADVGIISDVVQHAAVVARGNITLVPDFDSLPAGIKEKLKQGLILSRLVDTFISRISLTMLPVPNPHNTACVLSWEEARHWQSRSSGYSSS